MLTPKCTGIIKIASRLTEKIRTPKAVPSARFDNMHTTFVEQLSHNSQSTFESDKLFTFYVDINLPGVSDIPKTVVSVTSDYRIREATLKAIDQLNYELKGKGVRLETEMKYYSVRLPKKSGKPKLDMPCFDPNQTIVDVKIQALAVQIKNPEAIRIDEVKSPELTPQTQDSECYSRMKTEIHPIKPPSSGIAQI